MDIDEEWDSVMNSLRAGSKANPRAFKDAFWDFAQFGYTPEDLDDDIDLRDEGPVLGPVLKRKLPLERWGPKGEPLIEWLEYFRQVPRHVLLWAAQLLRSEDEEFGNDEYLLSTAHLLHRAGAVDTLWECLFRSIENRLEPEISREIAELLAINCGKATSASSHSKG